MKRTMKYMMMLCGLSLAVANVGCEDPHTAHMEEFMQSVYFRDGGVRHLSLTRAEESSYYSIPVCKSGFNASGIASVDIVVMDQAQLDIYNMVNSTDYRLVGPECFEFENEQSFTFASDESYHAVRLRLDVDALAAEQQAAEQVGKTPVVALQLYADVPLSHEMNYLILVPEVQTTYITFREQHFSREYSYVDPAVNTVVAQLRLPIDNEWDFDCELGIVDDVEAALAEVNASFGNPADGIVYKMLPEGSYEFPKRVSFVKGQSTADVNIRIDRYFKNYPREDENELPYYVLPLEIKSINSRGFDIHATNSRYTLRMSHEYRILMADVKEIALMKDMLDSPYTGENSLAELIDNDTNTFWGSLYLNQPDGDDIYGFYIDVTLPEPMVALQFRYCTRHNNDNALPNLVTIGCREDETSEWIVARSDIECPANGAAAWGDLAAVSLPMKSKYIRFGITSSRGGAGGNLKGSVAQYVSVAMSELQVKGSSSGARTVVIYDEADAE